MFPLLAYHTSFMQYVLKVNNICVDINVLWHISFPLTPPFPLQMMAPAYGRHAATTKMFTLITISMWQATPLMHDTTNWWPTTFPPTEQMSLQQPMVHMTMICPKPTSSPRQQHQYQIPPWGISHNQYNTMVGNTPKSLKHD